MYCQIETGGVPAFQTIRQLKQGECVYFREEFMDLGTLLHLGLLVASGERGGTAFGTFGSVWDSVAR